MRSFAQLLLLAASVPSYAGTSAITIKNWTKHPEILAIRSLYEDVEKNIRIGQFRCQAKALKGYEFQTDTVVDLCFDSQRKARRFIREGSSSGARATRSFYYDKRGHLRFLFVKAKARNATHIEHRVYFDKAGKRMWEFQKLISGPGYPFPKVWYDQDLVMRPWVFFDSK